MGDVPPGLTSVLWKICLQGWPWLASEATRKVLIIPRSLVGQHDAKTVQISGCAVYCQVEAAVISPNKNSGSWVSMSSITWTTFSKCCHKFLLWGLSASYVISPGKDPWSLVTVFPGFVPCTFFPLYIICCNKSTAMSEIIYAEFSESFCELLKLVWSWRSLWQGLITHWRIITLDLYSHEGMEIVHIGIGTYWAWFYLHCLQCFWLHSATWTQKIPL